MEATLDRYHALGCTPVVEEGATFFVDPARPDIWDANHARHVRAANADEIDALLARMDDLFAAGSHRRIVVDLDTPDALEARLSLDGWHVDPAAAAPAAGPPPRRPSSHRKVSTSASPRTTSRGASWSS